jgi:hypothetical protein
MVYKASLDKLAVVVTTSTWILIAVLAFRFAYVTDKTPLVIMLLTGLALVVGWAYHPVSYSINQTHLVIHRPLKNLLIDRDKIEAAFEVSKEDISYSVRLFGSGGFFGYFGKFANRKLGNMTLYATRRDGAVLIKTGGKKLIITPDSPEGFVKELNISERN